MAAPSPVGCAQSIDLLPSPFLSNHHRKLAVSVLCQAAPQSYESSLMLEKQPANYDAVDFREQRNVFLHGNRKTTNNYVSRNGSINGFSDVATAKGARLLRAKEDCYDGVIIDPCGLPANPDEFIASLRASVLHWKIQRKRGVWLNLPSEFAEYVPLAIKEGFQYHHAEPSHVMMTYWLPDAPSTLPPNASHQVGIGAFIMNDRREVLAVQEKTGPLRGLGVWKMPTGLINEGEDLCDGAVREVKEETGVDTKFMQVIGFRHGHLVSFGKSDLYFTCTLQPLSEGIDIEHHGEIEAAKWIPLQEFQSQDFFMESAARRKMLELCVASFDGHYQGFKATELLSGSLAQPTHYFFGQ